VQIVNRGVLEEFSRKHADVRKALDAWLAEVETAEWTAPENVKARYPSASLLSENRVIFNVKGNKYRLEVKISYAVGVVLVKRIGTHAEYGKWTF
jgi:mRNA interferase HigB